MSVQENAQAILAMAGEVSEARGRVAAADDKVVELQNRAAQVLGEVQWKITVDAAVIHAQTALEAAQDALGVLEGALTDVGTQISAGGS